MALYSTFLVLRYNQPWATDAATNWPGVTFSQSAVKWLTAEVWQMTQLFWLVVHRSLDQSEGLIQTDFRKLLESERKTTRILVILVDLWFSSDSKENPLWSIWASSWRNWYWLVSNYRYLRSKNPNLTSILRNTHWKCKVFLNKIETNV